MSSPLRVLHVITGLNTGGAERMLYQLVAGADRAKFDHRVVCLIPVGTTGKQIQALGVSVISLEMQPGRPTPVGFLRLVNVLRQAKPHILQTWLYHADLLGLLAGKLAGVPVILWNVRSSNMDFSLYRPLSRLVVRACAWLSLLPRGAVVNSHAGRVVHEQLGYRPHFWKFIPNGVDTRVFRPDPEARADIRKELGLTEETPLIGMIARYDPMKGHNIFMRAAAEIAAGNSLVHYLLAGENVNHVNKELMGLIAEYGLEERVHLLGHRHDVQRIDAGLDLLVSASFGEGFSNAVAEAMACGVPCVVTDVGDSRWLVGETGAVVPPRDAPALTQACLNLLSLSPDQRLKLGEQARQRVVDEFGIESVIATYEKLYREMAV